MSAPAEPPIIEVRLAGRVLYSMPVDLLLLASVYTGRVSPKLVGLLQPGTKAEVRLVMGNASAGTSFVVPDRSDE